MKTINNWMKKKELLFVIKEIFDFFISNVSRFTFQFQKMMNFELFVSLILTTFREMDIKVVAGLIICENKTPLYLNIFIESTEMEIRKYENLEIKKVCFIPVAEIDAYPSAKNGKIVVVNTEILYECSV